MPKFSLGKPLKELRIIIKIKSNTRFFYSEKFFTWWKG